MCRDHSRRYPDVRIPVAPGRPDGPGRPRPRPRFLCDDESSNGGNGTPDTPEGRSLALVRTSVLTFARQGYLGAYVQFLGSGKPSQPGCTPLDICSSGTAEICPNSEGATLNFDDCSASGVTTDGTLSVTGNALAGTALMNLSINGVQMAGTLFYAFTQQTGCLEDDCRKSANKEIDAVLH